MQSDYVLEYEIPDGKNAIECIRGEIAKYYELDESTDSKYRFRELKVTGMGRRLNFPVRCQMLEGHRT